MSAFRIKTAAEQRLEYLEGLNRPLSDQESDDLRRALHAVYCRNRRIHAETDLTAGPLAAHEREERALYERMRAEADA